MTHSRPFTAPMPVMVSLPLSLIGVVLALILTGGTLNLMSLIGVIMLMGLVAKNAILLLDCARKEEAAGVDREEALMHAGRQHLCQLPNHAGEIFVHVVATNVDAILLETFEVVLRTFFAKSKQIPGR